jgi:putative phage-type endonuclease
MAAEIVEMEQGSDEWLALRRKMRTASETATVMCCNPYQTPLQLARQKRQLDPPPPVTAAMQFGLDKEAEVREAASKYLASTESHPFYRTLSYHPTVLRGGDYLASLDGMMGDSIMEIKCPSSPRSGALQNAVYEPHFWQMQHQLMVSGAKRCHYVVRHPADGELIFKIVLPEPSAFAELRAAWDLFWREYMECDESDLVECAVIPDDLMPLVLDFHAAADAKRDAEASYKSARKALKSKLPDETASGHGLKVIHFERVGNVDLAAIERDHPDIDFDSYRKPTTSQMKFIDQRKGTKNGI